MRKALDALYGAALVASCLAMAAIAALVSIQVAGRIIDRAAVWLGMARPGIVVPSLAEIGGFLFVASVFLALPATLRAAGHVRVTLVLGAFGPRGDRILTILVLLGALGLACFAAWFSILQTLDSFRMGSVSFGLLRIPLWWPQSVMSLGLGLLVLALADELWAALRGGEPAFRAAERGRSTDAGAAH